MMMRGAITLVALLASVVLAHAEPSLVFRGDQFVPKYRSGNDQARLIEFVPPNETVENWTQLIGYRAIFESPQSARQAAAAIASAAQGRYPGAKPNVRAKGDEALVDFVATPPGGEYVEFNVFKYAPGKDGRGVVSFQYARRVRGVAPEDVRALGAAWVSEAASFDMNRVRASLTRTAPAGL
jgi:hypothetical protein